MGTAAPMRDFGPLINQKTLPRANAIIVSLAGLAFGGMALSAGPMDATAVGFLLFALGLLALCGWTFSYKATIYENGATVQSIYGNRSIRFTELRTFAYSRVLMRGQPQDTIIFVPRSGKPLRIVTQPDFRAGRDTDLARLVEKLTPKFVERMEKELTRAKRVAWVERVQGGLMAQPAVGLSREGYLVDDGKSAVTIHFARVDTSIVNGMFEAVELGTQRTLFRIACGSRNFYPGFTLQQQLREGGTAASMARPPGE
jgi:hypothetical protein